IGRGSRGYLGGQERLQAVQQQARAVLALARLFEVVEERAVFGEDQVRAAGGVGVQLNGRQRDRGQPSVGEHVVGEHDPLSVDDVVEAASEEVVCAVVVAACVQLAAADAEVQ